MHIKQIIIQGFKSYKEQTVIEPFSPGHNVIVGRNGSGKSNFFAAVRFVLSDAYTQLGREEKQALLHEGSGSAVMSAYVEIIFDNSDERFPTGKEEVIIRRTIGQIKDEYSLDRKSATKADVMNLLESAGFSRSNPYYIVPQGRVTTLTNMKDPERLTLLKEVAGTQVYEQRRAESLKIMDETDTKREKIDELLKYIEERLNELEEEKEELRGFQEKDREKRCLDYTLFHREALEISSAIDQIEENRLSSAHTNDAARKELQDLEAYVQNLDRELDNTRQQVALYKSEKKQLETEKQSQVRERARIELETNDLREDENQNRAMAAKREKELKDLQKLVQEKSAQLSKIMPEFDAKKAEEIQIRADLQEAEGTKTRLHAKQGRNERYKSKKERDNYLNQEIAETSANLNGMQSRKQALENDVATNQSHLQATQDQVDQLRANLSGRDENVSKCQAELDKARAHWSKLVDERKELHRSKRESDARLETAKSDAEKAERNLNYMMDRATAKGLQSMRRVKREMNLTGVYGTLAELCEVDDRYRTAVEATANTSLFNVVVDNDGTASRLIDALNAQNGGRLTCIPLNRVKARNHKYPDANDAIPMIDRIKFDPKFRKAFDHVFGRTIICPSLETASQYAKSHGLSAITLDGSSSDKRGALTGGHYDKSKSRLQGFKSVADAREQYQTELAENDRLRKQLDQLEQQITVAHGEERKAQNIRDKESNSYSPMKRSLDEKSQMISGLKDTLAESQNQLQMVTEGIKNLSSQLSAHQAELASDFKKSLSADEERMLELAIANTSTFKQRLKDLSKARAELERTKNDIELQISENYERRIDQLQNSAIDDRDGSMGSKKGSLKDSERELAKVSKSISKLEKKLADLDHNIEQNQVEIQRREETRATKHAEQAEAARTIERLQKKLEKGLSKKALLSERAAECQRNIRDLGVLPDEAFEKYESHASEALVKRLHKVQDALKKFSHVNKKAFEQYNNFTKQRNTLITRREELDTSRKSIEELIQVLDQRKDEAIERTFRQVSKNFAEIFEKLVPAGRGRLIIQRKVDKSRRQEVDADSDEEGGGGRSRDAIENYTGVGIAVSFNSKHDDQQRIQQLSGGQKSLCALALVFSIQQCDPAPFYLFDEIDANLDAQYRTAVAQMVKSLSTDGGQFICTTFRREMVLDADQHYGVTFENKMSGIDLVSKKEALSFVDGQKQ